MPRTLAHPDRWPNPALNLVHPAFPRHGAPDTICTVPLDRLSDARLERHLGEVLAAMRARAALLPDLRRCLADTLSELRAEALSGSQLTAEEIVELSEVAP